ncbi:mitochondrial uncoupling protein 4-like, partial [Branchiostoma floridae]|uniref:Mitochondrial uncoupling protein 4-like n=1 Tax=Branchiostoma floridae TaxID=7739 RepID=A0A9J7M6N3_BRAFL
YPIYCLTTVTYPLDLTKTRLQIQGELSKQTKQKVPYRGMLQTALGVAREEGVLKLWQGLTPAVQRHVVYSGCRMGAYEWIRDNVLGREPDGSFPVWKALDVLADFFCQLILSNFYKLQVRGTWHAFTKILAEGGIRGLWKGWVPNVQRAALVNMGDLATYDSAKRFILGHSSLSDGPIVHSLSSACSGIVAASLGTPADVVKTRIMNQPTDSMGRGTLYRSSVDCLVKTVRKEGVMALYKGFIPIWSRMAPWSLTFWLSYEQVRRLSGTTSF